MSLHEHKRKEFDGEAPMRPASKQHYSVMLIYSAEPNHEDYKINSSFHPDIGDIVHARNIEHYLAFRVLSRDIRIIPITEPLGDGAEGYGTDPREEQYLVKWIKAREVHKGGKDYRPRQKHTQRLAHFPATITARVANRDVLECNLTYLPRVGDICSHYYPPFKATYTYVVVSREIHMRQYSDGVYSAENVVLIIESLGKEQH